MISRLYCLNTQPQYHAFNPTAQYSNTLSPHYLHALIISTSPQLTTLQINTCNTMNHAQDTDTKTDYSNAFPKSIRHNFYIYRKGGNATQ
jgi:hypothetical protein